MPAIRPAGVIVVVSAVVVRGVAEDEFMGAGGEFVASGPFEGVFHLEKLRVNLDSAIEGEAADVDDLVEGDLGVHGAVDAGDGVDGVEALLEGVEFGGGDEVGFVEDDDVGEGHLLQGFG